MFLLRDAKPAAAPAKTVRRQEYRPPAYLVDRISLDITIDPKKTVVKSTLAVRRNPKAGQKALPLILDGEDMELVRIAINGRALTKSEYKIEPHTLTLPKVPIQFTMEIETIINPSANATLSGLYAAGPMMVTQCEAEGFRRITYYPDRPDVLARFAVTITADAKKYPVLLSNGNLTGKGKKGKQHWVKWEDPFPKPCYLFALVAGDLACVPDQFTTKSNRKVKIEAYVEHGQEKKVRIALNALKKAMKWDEDTYNLEYDLDRFMLVATSHFNMGAMENKGLNVFADDAVLGLPESATDSDIATIEAIVAHEYFHNWTGNRITCRDWFQLSLKEGLTVFREQQFMQDSYSSGVERVKDARLIRTRQFAEDAGPHAHPIRPDEYQAIDNFYTTTVYDKGSEVCRMLHTLLTDKGFKRGMEMYVKEHDGEAATCDDFVNAMADANDRDLSQFMRWYMQAGTPRVSVNEHYDAKRQRLTLNIRQETPETPNQTRKQPVLIPLAMGLLDKNGRDMVGTKILELRKGQETFTFEGLEERPVVSLLRQFSAPVRLERDISEEDLMHLLAFDNDTYTRWDAGQMLYRQYMDEYLRGYPMTLPEGFIAALRTTLRDDYLDEDYRALMFAVPGELDIATDLAARGYAVDPERIHEARQAVRKQMATALATDFADVFDALKPDPEKYDGQAMGERALRAVCLAYLMLNDAPASMERAGVLIHSLNMTDQLDGLSQLSEHDPKAAQKALDTFYKTWKKDTLVVRKWMVVQSAAQRADTVEACKKLMQHAAYDRKQPKNVRAVVGVLAHSNPLAFHRADGAGYKMVATEIAAIDKFNPIIAARLATAFQSWRDLEPKRQKLIERELKTLKAVKTLSRNTAEIVTKALAMPAVKRGTIEIRRVRRAA